MMLQSYSRLSPGSDFSTPAETPPLKTYLHGPSLPLRSSLSLYFFVPAHLPHYKKGKLYRGKKWEWAWGRNGNQGNGYVEEDVIRDRM